MATPSRRPLAVTQTALILWFHPTVQGLHQRPPSQVVRRHVYPIGQESCMPPAAACAPGAVPSANRTPDRLHPFLSMRPCWALALAGTCLPLKWQESSSATWRTCQLPVTISTSVRRPCPAPPSHASMTLLDNLTTRVISMAIAVVIFCWPKLYDVTPFHYLVSPV